MKNFFAKLLVNGEDIVRLAREIMEETDKLGIVHEARKGASLAILRMVEKLKEEGIVGEKVMSEVRAMLDKWNGSVDTDRDRG